MFTLCECEIKERDGEKRMDRGREKKREREQMIEERMVGWKKMIDNKGKRRVQERGREGERKEEKGRDEKRRGDNYDR